MWSTRNERRFPSAAFRSTSWNAFEKQHNQNGCWIQRPALVLTCWCNPDHLHTSGGATQPDVGSSGLCSCFLTASLNCGGRNMVEVKMKAPRGAAPTLRRRGPPGRLSVRLVQAFLLLFMVTPALSIHLESLGSHSEFSCEPIRLRMCQDLPYNTTFMPNLLNHYDQQTAALAMEVGCFSRWVHFLNFFFFLTPLIWQIDKIDSP